jgi:GTP-binding protein
VTPRAAVVEAAGLPVVAIVGRPNVGKSTLFNRIVRARRAIVDDAPGVTRDRVVAAATHGGRRFLAVDTGGFATADEADATTIAGRVRAQALVAVGEADCVVWVVDGPAGLLPADREILDVLRRSGKPLVVAVNKVDTAGHEALVSDFFALGIEAPHAVSAAHGRGVPELLDAVTAVLPPAAGETDAVPAPTRIALVGRPNVGKSSILNRLLGAERTIVAPEAGTTRDAVDTPIRIGDRPYVLIDTAGIRRRGRIREPLEGHGAVRALGTLERTDLVLVVLDATEGVTEQDARLVGRAWEAGRGCILVANKWDAMPRDRRDPRAFREAVEATYPVFGPLPLVCVSAATGEGLDALWPLVARVERAYDATLPTSLLNRALAVAVDATPPPNPRGRPLRFYYATQTGRRPPAVVVFTNMPADVPAAYARYLTARLGERFRLTGVPLVLTFRPRTGGRTPGGSPRAGGRARGKRSSPTRGRGGRPRRR